MKIKVTNIHIKNGKAWLGDECPVALAIKDKMLETMSADLITVGNNIVQIRHDGKIHGFLLPPEAVKFIKRYDTCMPVEPFEFELEKLMPITSTVLGLGAA